MPRTPAEVDVVLNQLMAENAKQAEQIKNLQAIVGVGTAPAPAVSLAAIAEELKPIAVYTKKILAVQGGALGVKP